MYKIITIGGKDYKIEYTVEASLYKDCTDRVIDYIEKTAKAEDEQDVHKMLSTLTDIPQTTLIVFYAGLLEYHSDEVETINDAKALVKEYFNEHKEDGEGNFYSLLKLLMEQMGKDNFFSQIGLTQGIEEAQTKEVKKPQDHKKKAKA